MGWYVFEVVRRERGGGGGEGEERAEEHKTEQQNGHFGYFVVLFDQ